VQVIEEHHGRLTPGHARERIAQRRRQGEAVDDPGRRAEFRQQRGKVAREVSGPGERARGDAVVGPQGRDDRRVRSLSPIADDTTQEKQRTIAHGGMSQARLPHTRLTRHENEAAVPRGSPVEPVAEYLQLPVTPDELGACRHLESVRRLPRGRQRAARACPPSSHAQTARIAAAADTFRH
jgi:hypothetical protein